MLSRIADSLYWIGRYVERAEDTTRILDVHLQQFVEDPTTDQQEAAAALMAAMGFDLEELPEETIDAGVVLRYLCYDADEPTSIRAMVAAVREAARRVRETISAELWEAINTTYHEVNSRGFARLRPTAALQQARLRCVHIAGLATQSMVRDEAFCFLELGRFVERVDMTSRLIRTVSGHESRMVFWARALRAVGGYHAFTRTYAGEGDQFDAARFLIVDRRFPRSLVYGLQSVQDALGELEPINVKMRQDPVARLVGRTRSQLEYMDPADLVVDLPERMEQIQIAMSEVNEQISQRYFEGATAAIWRREMLACG